MKTFTHAHAHTFEIEELGFGERKKIWNTLSERLAPNSAHFSLINDRDENIALGNVYETLLGLRDELHSLQSGGKESVPVLQWDNNKKKEIEKETAIQELLLKIEDRITYLDNFFNSIVAARSYLPENNENLNFREAFDKDRRYQMKLERVKEYTEGQKILSSISLTDSDRVLLYGSEVDINTHQFLDNAKKILNFHENFSKLPEKFQKEVSEKLKNMQNKLDVKFLYTEVINIIEGVQENNLHLHLDKSFKENVKLYNKLNTKDSRQASILI